MAKQREQRAWVSEHVFAFAEGIRMWRKIVYGAVIVCYVPAMLSLLGLRWWWFRATGMDRDLNPVVTILWFFLRVLPGVLGFTGLLMGPILLSELSDARFLRAVRAAQVLCREHEEGA